MCASRHSTKCSLWLLIIVYRPLGMWEPTCSEGAFYLVHWGKYGNHFSSWQLLPAYFLAEVFFLTKIGRAKYLVCQAGCPLMQVTSQLKDPSFSVTLENSWVLGSWWLWAKAVQLSQLFFKWVELKLVQGSQEANTLRVLALVGILRAYNVLFWILNRRVGANLIQFFLL